MKDREELQLVTRHRPLVDIQAALANKDMEHQAKKLEAKTIADGFKTQLDILSTELDRLRTEYMAASIAAEGSR